MMARRFSPLGCAAPTVFVFQVFHYHLKGGFSMKPQNEEQKLSEGQPKAKKRRFRIERLEQRIAPHHRAGHIEPPVRIIASRIVSTGHVRTPGLLSSQRNGAPADFSGARGLARPRPPSTDH